MTYQIKLECEIQNFVGESPTYSYQNHQLYWVDVKGGSVHQLDLKTQQREDFLMPYVCPFLALTQNQEDLLVGLKRSIYQFNIKTQQLNKMTEVEPDLFQNRFNDAKCDPKGRLWFSTMKNNFGDDGEDLPIDEKTGSLYCLDTNLECRHIESHFGIPNTVAFSPDHQKFYLGDSLSNLLFVYDFDVEQGIISNKKEFAKNLDQGHLDGSAMDEEGCLWNTHWGSSKIVRYSPSGEILEEVVMPVPAPSSCAFGGDDMKTLYVTTARETLTQQELEKYPLSGSIFSFQTDVAGVEVSHFQGE